MKRLFIAVPVHEKSRMEIVRGILNQDTARKMPVRWTSYENLHLTIQFLGDVEEKRISELRNILEKYQTIVRENLSFSHVGAFPDPAAPRIIWLGFKKNESLLNLQRRITSSLSAEGFPVDHKPYKPHLTIGRVREGVRLSPDAFAGLEELASRTAISDTPMDKLTLFESRLQPGGPVYTALFEKKLYS